MATQLSLRGASIGYRNFAGIEGQYNKAGDRNFAVFMDIEQAEELAQDGWNIKKLDEAKAELDDPENEYPKRPYLPVSVALDGMYPSQIYILRHDPESELANEEGYVATEVTSESADILDSALIKNADVVIRPYNWSVNGNSGVKAYLRRLYVTLDEDEFASKYGIH